MIEEKKYPNKLFITYKISHSTLGNIAQLGMDWNFEAYPLKSVEGLFVMLGWAASYSTGPKYSRLGS